jgi:hypothetical protein
MAQNDQDFECRQCGAHFDSRDQLDRHTRQQHTAQAGSSQSGSSSDSGRRQDGQRGFDDDDSDLNN